MTGLELTEYYTKKNPNNPDNQEGVITHLELFFFFKPRANDYTTKQLILLKVMFKASACNVGDLGSLGWEDPLEKEMATHSSILAWRIPWTEEPGGLHSTGSQRVGHN